MAREQAITQETIVERITRDHRRTDLEIAELEMRIRGRGDEDLGPVFAPMKRALLGHMAAEEKLLYPLLERGDLQLEIAEARREHDRIRGHLDELASGGRMEETEWRRRLNEAKQTIQHHYTGEEGEILPAVRRAIDEDRLRDLGTRFGRMETEDR